LKLTNARHTPSSFVNTISEDIIEKHGVGWRSDKQHFISLPPGSEFSSVTKQNGLKIIDATSALPAQHHAILVSDDNPDISTLHRCFAHLHVDGVKSLIRRKSIPSNPSLDLPKCDACLRAKSTQIICC
jgi:hypothetical protein